MGKRLLSATLLQPCVGEQARFEAAAFADCAVVPEIVDNRLDAVQGEAAYLWKS